MKKVFFMAVAAMMLATATAKAESFATEVDYNLNLQMRNVNKVLLMDDVQYNAIEQSTYALNRRVKRVKRVPVEQRAEKLEAILMANVAEAREYLDDRQYRDYLTLLNRSLNRNGLNTVLLFDLMACAE